MTTLTKLFYVGTLVNRDFFDVPEKPNFDVIVGNPPWTSRRGPNRSSVRWCAKNGLPMPDREDAWAFTWKALRHLTPEGLAAFLLPAMGFLHNFADSSLEARRRLVRESRIRRVINFADLRFQLFDGAIRPTALIMFAPRVGADAEYRFEYWTPKADLNLQIKRMITLSSADKSAMKSATAQFDPLAFKNRLWMREPDDKLFSYLSKLPKLGSLIKEFKTFSRSHQSVAGQWVIGMGYQPYNEPDKDQAATKYSMSKLVGTLPDLPIESFRAVVQATAHLKPARSKRVRRKGFEAGFTGARILVPRTTSLGRLRAAYTEADLTFQDIIQGITVPENDSAKGKLLAALLNSRIAAWYAFHGTASFGSERPEVKQSGLIQLPFPTPDDLPEPSRAEAAAARLIALIDKELRKADGPFSLGQDEDVVLAEIDRWAYEYFCLSQDEIILIEDMIERILPAVQPHQGSFPDLWKAPTEAERAAYATTLMRSVKDWFDSGTEFHARLEARNADLGILCLNFDSSSHQRGYVEDHGGVALGDALSRLMKHVHQPIGGNFQLIPDLRVFIGKNLYFIKPMQRRFWLQSTALSDADAIASDLQHAVDIDARRMRA